jgi:hypothetical protein
VVAYESADFSNEALYLLDAEAPGEEPRIDALLAGLEQRLGLGP